MLFEKEDTVFKILKQVKIVHILLTELGMKAIPMSKKLPYEQSEHGNLASW